MGTQALPVYIEYKTTYVEMEDGVELPFITAWLVFPGNQKREISRFGARVSMNEKAMGLWKEAVATLVKEWLVEESGVEEEKIHFVEEPGNNN